MAKRGPIVAVSGGGNADEATCAIAEDVGRALAKAGALVLSGGLGGVMEACCRGAKEAGGTTIGIVPGTRTDIANDYVDIPIASGMADGRNVMIVQTADAVIALPGRYGTLSEVAFALLYNKPVISIGSWRPDDMVKSAANAKEAVAMVLSELRVGAGETS